MRVAADGVVTVRLGKVELGQGILTALAQIAADELDVDLAQLRVLPATTVDGPDEGLTAGSRSVAAAGAALRDECAQLRALFVAHAIATRGLDPATVTVHGGVVADAAGRAASYGELAGEVDLERATAAQPKRASELRVVGTSVPRLDLPDKVTGRPRFIHDVALPGLRHGRVVRPPSPGATLVDVEGVPDNAVVVRDRSFLGVVAESEEDAVRAAATLAETARWAERDTLPDEDDLPAYLRSGPVETTVVAEATGPAPAAARRVTARYSRPFLAHASIAPSCGIARWDGDAVEVWSHTQGVHPLRRAVAQALHLDAARVTVSHVESAGCYGHNGADDAAFDAVLLARAVPGRPVRVLWSRRDELAWAPFGSAMAIDVAAGLDAAGNVVDWSFDVWSQGHVARPGYAGTPGFLALAHLSGDAEPLPAADPPLPDGGSARNAVPGYAFPRRRVVAHRALRTALRSSSLRSLGAFANVFAIESFMDELAAAAGRDPVEFRLAHLTDPRARAVIEAAAARTPRQPAENAGFGLGYARYKNSGGYCAVVAEVEATHEIRVRRLTAAVDVGRVVNPDGLRNQIEGGAVQATSWTLKERVRFDRRRVTSVDWEAYPILRFTEAPAVDVVLLDRPDEPSLGAGEAAQGPTAAAIANAVADALGVRVRDLPLTPERVIAAISSP
ncbi:molybdopterin cofactor-binding domain-containing protein [Actinomycetes bacterium KLBMP 9797]